MAHTLKLEEGEKIIQTVRRHIFVFYVQTFALFVFAILPLIFIFPITSFIEGIVENGGDTLFWIGYGFWLIILWMIVFFRWTDYYLDAWVITDKRIFDIEQVNLFHREISVFRLERVQDVTVEVKGVFATFIKFGNIKINTAGDHDELIIRDAAQPIDVKNTIMEMVRNASTTPDAIQEMKKEGI